MENKMNTAGSQNSTEENSPNGINGNTIDSEPLDLDGMTDFELADVFLQRCAIIKIEGELHCFNGKHFVLLDDKQLNRLIWSAFQNEKKQIRSSKKIKAIADALRLYEFPDYQESDQWLAFENGFLNIVGWQFDELNKGYYPPCVTYNLRCSYDFTMHHSLSIISFGYNSVDEFMGNIHFPPTPTADYFFSRVTNSDPMLIQRIYEMIGYLLVPDTHAKSFFLLQGVPNSGKSVLGRFIEGFFPKQCVTALDISRLSGQFLPKSLATSRLNLSMDLPDGLLSKKAVAMLKMLTGDDLVTLEVKYKEARPYRGQCKFLFSINGKLKMYGRDTAFLDRIVCIPFVNSIPKTEWDKYLLLKLDNEREGIMMKALFYYRFLSKRNGKFSGDYPPDVEFRLSENETIEEFVSECCDLMESFSSYTDDLYSAYQAFCSINNLRPVRSKSGFAQRLSGLYPTKIKATRWREDNRNIRGFNGIILKTKVADAYKNDGKSEN